MREKPRTSFAQPLVELFYEARNRYSPYQRTLAEAIRSAEVPRRDDLSGAVGRLLAPWWGFAVYFIPYAMVVVSLAALVGASLVAALVHKAGLLPTADEMTFFVPGLLLTAPVSFWPFRRWVRRRRSGLVEVAAQGRCVVGQIASATTYTVHAGISLRGAAHSTRFAITSFDAGPGSFRGFVARGPGWVVPGENVYLVAAPTCRYALLLTPDGGIRPLERS